MCNNQGIVHAYRGAKAFGNLLCRNRKAHMAVPIEQFRIEPHVCKRCAAQLAKMDEVKARAQAKAEGRP